MTAAVSVGSPAAPLPFLPSFLMSCAAPALPARISSRQNDGDSRFVSLITRSPASQNRRSAPESGSANPCTSASSSK